MAERQLPKLNVAGSIPVSRSRRINALQKALKTCAPNVLHLHDLKASCEMVHCLHPVFDRGLSVDVLTDIEAVAKLVCDEFSVHA